MNMESETPQNQNTEAGLDQESIQAAYPANIPEQAVCLDPDGNIRLWVDSQLNGNVIDIGQEPGYVSAVETIEASLADIERPRYDPDEVMYEVTGQELYAWDKIIQPLSRKYFDGFFVRPFPFDREYKVFTYSQYEEIERRITLCCYKGFTSIFNSPHDNSIFEVIRRLWASQEVYTENKTLGAVALKEILYGFLHSLIVDEKLPLFLIYLQHHEDDEHLGHVIMPGVGKLGPCSLGIGGGITINPDEISHITTIGSKVELSLKNGEEVSVNGIEGDAFIEGLARTIGTNTDKFCLGLHTFKYDHKNRE